MSDVGEVLSKLTVDAASLAKVADSAASSLPRGVTELAINHTSGLLKAAAELGMREAMVPIFDPGGVLDRSGFVEELVDRLEANGFIVSSAKISGTRNAIPRVRLTVTW